MLATISKEDVTNSIEESNKVSNEELDEGIARSIEVNVPVYKTNDEVSKLEINIIGSPANPS